MRGLTLLLLTVAACVQLACTRSPKTADSPKPEPVRITQFYATAPQLPRGEKELLCYGVENAKTVWLTPPRQDLTASATRCVEANPTATTTYTLSAQGATGVPITQEVTVTVGPPRAKIIEVKISSLEIKRGDLLSICYLVENAKSVEIQPIRYKAGSQAKNCTTLHPVHTVEYVVSAIGADGDKDEERVTVKVK